MNFLKHTLPIAIATVALCSCSDISKDDRFIELPPVQSARVVLLEEFTGQKCVNCPEAHTLIQQLTEQYPDNFVAVSIHGGGDFWSFSEDKFAFGLRTEEGQKYSDGYGVGATLPVGIVNRTSGVTNRDKWGALIVDEINKPAMASIEVSASYNPADNSINVSTLVNSHDNFSANLQLWVIENGIVAMQSKPSGTDMNYVHNHVFRGCVNGFEGEPFKGTPHGTISFENSINKKEKWNADNLEVVAFAYNESGVIQAAKAHVATAEP